MTSRSLSFSVVLSSSLGALAFALAAACGGTFEPGGRTQTAKPGTPCSGNQTAPSDDGCNTCSCSGGSWACTEKACLPPDAGPSQCVPGQRKPGDTCNACSCNEQGQWQCTFIACPPPACTDGETTNDGCNSCTCSGGGWVCTNQYCPPPPPPPPPPPLQCANGDVMTVDCNTCTCMNGNWSCTKRACPPPACVDGQTTYDGCNTCSCFGGQWACTARACPPPPPPMDAGPPKTMCGGWFGDTCTPDEYCAYQPGAMCGAGDASSVCEPRPGVCDTLYDPVCGCDGNNYGNACEAAMARTGVYSKGMCPITH